MDDRADSVRAATEPPRGRAPGGHSLAACTVRLSVADAVVPPECACCGAVASSSVREARLIESSALLVPYCGACHAHVTRAATRRLAVGLSSALLACTLAAGLPLLFQPAGLSVHLAIVGTFAVLPLLLARLWRRRPEPGHAAAARAVWFRLDGALVCASVAWGRRLSLASAAPPPAEVRVLEPEAPRWAVAVVLVAFLATSFLYELHFPEVRIVNVTDRPLTVRVDGRPRGRVEPTSGESATAGLVVRVPAGRRTLTATDTEGGLVDTASVLVEAGTGHLYAPGSEGTCFWLETTGYGRSRAAGTQRDPLSGRPRFWALPARVDFWFAPPPPLDGDDRSTGGVVRAVRQARCEDAPR
jgi:hypothetical protein